jgi:ribosome-binding factor A
VPELKFRWDESIERAAHIMDVIDRVNRDDDDG